MNTLALVYIEATKHIVSSVLVQSGFSAPPKLEDLVGTGPLIRKPGTDADWGSQTINLAGPPAINVASTSVSLKVLVLDSKWVASNSDKVNGLLNNPLDYSLQRKEPDNPNSPLVPILAQADGLKLLTDPPITGNTNTVELVTPTSKSLQLVTLVQRGSIDSSPITSPQNTVGPTKAPLQVTLQQKDTVWILVETFRPLLKIVS